MNHKEPSTKNYMSQTIRSQLRGTATSKTFRYPDSPEKAGNKAPSAETIDQTPTKISKLQYQ